MTLEARSFLWHVLSTEPFCLLKSKSPLKSNLNSFKMQGLLNTTAASYDLDTKSWDGLSIITNISPQIHQKNRFFNISLEVQVTFQLQIQAILISEEPTLVCQCLSFSPTQLEDSQVCTCIPSCHSGFGLKKSMPSSLFLPSSTFSPKCRRDKQKTLIPWP